MENSKKSIVFYICRKTYYDDDERAREGTSAASKFQVVGIIHKVIQHYSKNPNPHRHLDTFLFWVR